MPSTHKPSAAIILSILAVVFFCVPVYCQEKEAAGSSDKVEMSLTDTVLLAVKKNRTIESAYLDRIVQRYDLKVAEDKFTPQPVLTTSVQKDVEKSNGISVVNKNAVLSGVVTETLPTGALFNLDVSRIIDKADSSTTRTSSWNVSLTQPLLKGGGIEVTTASVKTARITNKMDVLALQATVMDTVTSVIVAYRGLLQADRQLEINRQSLERAKKLVAVNRELISAGRMAEVEIVQAEAEVSSREFDLLSAENSVDSARLSLIKLLDIDRHTMIVPTEKVGLEPAVLDFEQCKALAFNNRPDYLIALLGLETSKINLMLAKNNKLWDLSLFGGYGGIDPQGHGNNVSNWNAGIALTIPFRDLTLEQGYISAKINLDKTELNLAKLHDNIEIDIKDAIRDAEIKMRQVALAKQTTKLSERKLEIETEKMKAGRSTNFQLVTYNNDLVNAQNNELSAIITYLNSLTSLDRTLGTTLARWSITIDERD
jgi:outer membrane protein TolC